MSTCLDVSTTKPLPMIIVGIYVQYWISKLIVGQPENKRETDAATNMRNECLSQSDKERETASSPSVLCEEELDHLIMNGNMTRAKGERKHTNYCKSACWHIFLWIIRVWQSVSFLGVFGLDIWSFYTFVELNPTESPWGYYQCLALLYSNSSNFKTWIIGFIAILQLPKDVIKSDLYIQSMLFVYFLYGVTSIPIWITHTIPAFFVYIWIPLIGLILFTMIFSLMECVFMCNAKCGNVLSIIFGMPQNRSKVTESPIGLMTIVFTFFMLPALCQCYWYLGYGYMQSFVSVLWTGRSMTVYFNNLSIQLTSLFRLAATLL